MNNEIQLINENIQQFEEHKIADVGQKDGLFWLLPQNWAKIQQNLENQEDIQANDESSWIVIKSLKHLNGNKGVKLQQNDIIKLGRVRFRIKEIKCDSIIQLEQKKGKVEQELTDIAGDDIGKLSPQLNNNMGQSVILEAQCNSMTCRICLSESPEIGNPFISPCLCSGTMKYIHIKCLQQWLTSRLSVKETVHGKSWYWKNFDCELCKKAFPNFIFAEGKRFEIVEISKPDGPYIILEMLSRGTNQSRGIHLISMENKNTVKLGRGHDNEVRITDISVSRFHAMIKLDKTGFYLEDNNSKFGTLLLVKQPLAITSENNNICIQIGRSVLSFTLKKAIKIFPYIFGQKSHQNVNQNDLFTQTAAVQKPQQNENIAVLNKNNLENIINNNINQNSRNDQRGNSRQVITLNNILGHNQDDVQEDIQENNRNMFNSELIESNLILPIKNDNGVETQRKIVNNENLIK